MPVEATFRNIHSQIPGEVSGYELAPSLTGLWSIVTPTGTVINLNSLNIQVTGYTGGGMPPIENISIPYGILGGSLLQKTVVRPRLITLNCVVQGLTLAQVQQLKNKIIAQIAPYNSLQSSRGISLRYQLVNYCGDAIGTILQVPVTYAGDLTGSTTNLYQDRFDLQFIEYNPPSIKELTTNTVSLNYNLTRTTSTGLRYKSPNGDWKYISYATPTGLHYDMSGELWYGSNSVLTNRSGSVSQAVNQAVYTITHDQNNVLYAAGNFTSPQNYIMKYSGGVWSAVGATINGVVTKLAFDNVGNLYATGGFTTPVGGIGKWNGSAWSALGTGTNGTNHTVIKGMDGYMYVAGSFTTANGVACNNIAKWNGTTFEPLGSGTNGVIYGLANLPDGRLAICGSFSTAGGVTCNNVAVWNGTQWQQLGAGIVGIVGDIFASPLNGDIYANGIYAANGSGVNLSVGFSKYNGSSWVPQDAQNSTVGAFFRTTMDIRQSDGELALLTAYTAGTFNNGVLNTVTYSGTADVNPQIKLTGPGVPWVITNYTTGKSIYFYNYTMLAGETALLTYDPTEGLSFISSFYGNIINRLLPGSDLSQFSLIPGANSIVPFISSVTGATKCEIIYQNTHYSFESGAS